MRQTLIVGPALIPAASLLSGCANMSSSEQSTLSGAAIGTAAGAVVGAATGE